PLQICYNITGFVTGGNINKSLIRISFSLKTVVCFSLGSLFVQGYNRLSGAVSRISLKEVKLN
ncbi:hypothetical protein, partial [Klebsiella pneumoniae]|uniref:hypothetical protein n=1 Tax=Klebsiella pneumoniae TaxID=573 RepID=UPI003EBAB1CD